MLRHNAYRMMLLIVVIVTLLGLPIAAGAAGPNGITSVKDGATVSGAVEIKGMADDPAFARWQLDLLPGGMSDAAIFLATDAKSGEFSYTLDTTKYPDGEHALRLRVVRPDGNYNEYVTKFTIANKAAKPAAPVVAVAATAPVTATIATTATMAAKPAAPVTTTVATTATMAAKPAAPVTTTVAATPTVTAKPAVVANGVTSVKDGATVSGAVEIKGMANDPAFARWQLDLLPGGMSDAAIFLATDAKSGEFSYTLDTTKYPDGEHALRLRVVHPDSNYNEYVTKFTIANKAAKPAAPVAAVAATAPVTTTVATTATMAAKPAAPVTTTVAATPTVAAKPAVMANGVTSVKDGATVSGVVDVKGMANDPAFARWQLDLLPGGMSDAAIFLATDAKSGEFSYTLDTTKYPDGEHALRLRVVRPDGNYAEYVTKLTIANKAAKPA